jgi:Ala-tRNA(Pro) deacylase
MPVKRLKEFLDSNQIKYRTITHSPAVTAQEIAAAAHLSGKLIAKTVIVLLDGEMAMVVVPAHRQVNLETLREATGAGEVRLATEEEFQDRFSGCELGGMPPFGNLYEMDVFVAEELTRDEEIAFNAGSHSELIQMTYKDYEQLVQPKVLKLAVG